VLLGVAAAPLILLALIGATLIRIRRSWTLLQARFPSTPPSPEPPAAEAVAD
jgi:hypothetical protein